MRLLAFLKSPRLWGLAGIALTGYLIFFVLLGQTDVSWMLPTKKMAATLSETWPDLPFFTTQRESSATTTETYYTVPTRQLSPQEVSHLGATNQDLKPVSPK